MCILNCTKLCKGKYTWFCNDLIGAIDYMLCSTNVIKDTSEFIVDDDRNLNLGSDHNVLLLLKCTLIKPVKNNANQDKDNCLVWDIKPNQDWSNFQNKINHKFSDWNIDEYDTVALTIFGILGKKILFRLQINPLALAKVILSYVAGGIKILINVLKNVKMLAKDIDNGVKEIVMIINLGKIFGTIIKQNVTVSKIPLKKRL